MSRLLRLLRLLRPLHHAPLVVAAAALSSSCGALEARAADQPAQTAEIDIGVRVAEIVTVVDRAVVILGLQREVFLTSQQRFTQAVDDGLNLIFESYLG